MATRSPPTGDGPARAGEAGTSARESAQQIWLAGLGAFSKAQAEGGKVFEALVKEGLSMQQKTQSAGERLSEAASRMANMAGLASSFGAKAAAPWDRLENIFEERVAKALANLGVPSGTDFKALADRVAALEKAAAAPAKPAARRPSKTTSAGKAATPRAPRKAA
jgi:poly(hydroxyalkanoate) granule-associated protein